jgi:putative ABC transport system ATP-binding protein
MGSQSNAPLIRTEAMGKSFSTGTGRLDVLSRVTLGIELGEMVAIMGPSGSGKSTLLNLLGCLDWPTAGRYWFAGKAVRDLGTAEIAALRNRHIGFVFQSFNLLPRLTATQNVELPLAYAGVSARERRRRASESLDEMGLADRAHHLPQQLSGGQQQRVAIARALVNHPQLILADEPTGALESHSGRAILTLFQDLNRSGVTLIIVTHDRSVAGFAKRIVRVRDGRVVSDRTNPDVGNDHLGDPATGPL